MFYVIRDYMKFSLCGDTIRALQNEIYGYRRRLDNLTMVVDSMDTLRYWCNSDVIISYKDFVDKCNVFLGVLNHTNDMEEMIEKLSNILKESE